MSGRISPLLRLLARAADIPRGRHHRRYVMLVLSRKVGERVLIGPDIRITVVRIAGGGVRLGIEAPPELPIMREELHESTSRAEPPPKRPK